MKKKVNIKNFYGTYSSGAQNLGNEEDFFSDKNFKTFNEEISLNCKRLKIDSKKLFNKNIMNVGSGREALGFLEFKPKVIDHFDISKRNVLNFKKIIRKKKLRNKIISKQLDLSKDNLPKKKYDLIYLHGIIQHVDHVGKAIKNISNSLKKNGVVWFYFYRPGSLANFLGSIQRYILKETDIDYFFKQLKKKNYNYKFVDRLMDDCFVSNRQLFHPKDYLDSLKRLNLVKYGSSLLVNSYQKINFYKFHSSVIFFLKKTSDKKFKTNFADLLKPEDQINDLDIKLYKKNKQVCNILNIFFNKELNKDNIFKKIVLIEKLKTKVKKDFFIKKKLSKPYVKTILENLELIIKKK